MSSLNPSKGKFSTTDLMVATYRPFAEADPDKFLACRSPHSNFFNSFLEESPAVLTRTLYLRQSKTSSPILSSHITVPLHGLLHAVASIHADSQTRLSCAMASARS